jgi:hypothetical protein
MAKIVFALRQVIELVNNFGSGNSITTNHSVLNSDNGETLLLSGGGTAAIKTISFAAATEFDTNFQLRIINNDTRGWAIAPTGVTTFILWPGQTCTVFAGSTWFVDAPARWKPAGGGIYYVNPSGNDANDGLVTGAASAFATIQHAVDIIHKTLDMTDQGAGINLDDGTHNVGSGVFIAYAMQAGQIVIQGNAVTPLDTIVKGDAGSIIFNIQEPATISIADMGIDGSNGNCTGISARQFSTLDVRALTFINFTGGTCLSLTNHSSGGAIGDLTWAGNFSTGISVTDHSFFNCSGNQFHVGAVTASIFLFVEDLSKVNAGVTVIDAGLTGQKFFVDYLSKIQSNGTTFPGTIAGFTGVNAAFHV